MKKRLLSLLLTVCLLAALFTGLATPAAAADTITGYLVKYVFQAGDTIYGVCEAKGIDFATNLNKIAKINNITNYNYMMPGKVLWIPSKTATTAEPYYSLLAHTLAAGETPVTLCQSYGVDYNANYNLLAALNNNLTVFMAGQIFTLPIYVDPKGGTTPTPTPTPEPGTTPAPTPAPTPGPAIPEGDNLSYYLAQHVLQAGETVSGVCAALGIDFGKEDVRIRTINNIANYNYMLPGKVLLLPTTAKPTNGSYYQVMTHTVVYGDTVYALCGQYGLNFNTYQTLIQRLNNRNNLASFFPGDALYMPLYVSAPSGNVPTPAPGGNTPAPTATPEPGTTPAPGGATPTPPPQNIPEADTLSYLIIPHVLQGGETVSGICAELGVDFMANYDRIMQLSNIANYNYMLPGKLVLIPSTTYPSSGPYYKIMAHTLVAGDTVYDLCIRYGLDYTSNAAFLQRLNNRDNLATYYVGQTVYMPLYVAG